MNSEFEIFCYEEEDGSICLEFGESGIRFSKERFIEFSARMNEVSQELLYSMADDGAFFPIGKNLTAEKSYNEV
jgi:hypothetical protein